MRAGSWVEHQWRSLRLEGQALQSSECFPKRLGKQPNNRREADAPNHAAFTRLNNSQSNVRLAFHASRSVKVGAMGSAGA